MTLELPSALSPWRASLDLFPPDLAHALAAVVARIAVLVGPLERPSARGDGEPDGFHGIARRGPFERLLPTEWALLDAWPDEFMRRAAMHDLAFFELARQEPSADRRSIALFDAGTDQLGGPRIAHLAALILLHARARDAGADFAWGILQDPTCEMTVELTQSSIRRLVRSGFRARVSRVDAQRWLAAIDPRNAAPVKSAEVEVWVVGSASAADAVGPDRSRALIVEDILDPARRSWISVSAHVPRRSPRSAELPLPDAPSAIRLLRDPFGVAAPRAQHAPRFEEGAFQSVFSATGRKLYARSADGALVTFSVPNSPNAPPVRPSVCAFPAGHDLVAVGQRRRRTIAITCSVDGYAEVQLSRGETSVIATSLLRASDGERPHPSRRLVPVCAAENDTAFFQDERGHLLCSAFGVLRDHLPWQVLAFRAEPRAPETISSEPTPVQRVFKGTSWDQASGGPIPAYAHKGRVFFGTGNMFATLAGENTWRLSNGGPCDHIRVEPTERVVGVTSRLSPSISFALVIVRDRRVIELINSRGERNIVCHLETDLDHAEVSPHSPTLAVVMGKALVLYSLWSGQACARYQLEGT